MAVITPPRPLLKGDDRTQFDCGRGSMNHWFRRYAWRNQDMDVTRTNVICDAGTRAIIGYVTLSASQIDRGALSKPQQRNKPDPVPAFLLGQLAVDTAYQGRGHAASLLFFALKTSLNISREVGAFGVITHPLDHNIRKFYQKWGFQDTPYDPKQSMIVRMVDLEKNGFG